METLVELIAKITADASGLKKALSESEKDFKGLGKTTDKETKSIKDKFLEIGKTATIAGTAITATMGMIVNSFVKTGSELNDLSLKTGVSAKALAGLKYAAEQNGASLGTVEMAIRRTASALQDAKDGLSASKKAFDRLNLSIDDLQELNVEQQFLRIANAIAEIPDPMTRAATAQDLFGRSGADMLPMLSEGADGLKKMMEEGVKLTGWTDQGVKSADALGDSFSTLKTSMMGVFNTIGESLAPVLKTLTDALTGIIGNVNEWIRNNPSLVKAISTATVAVGLLATAIGLGSLAAKFFGNTVNLYFGGILLITGAVITGILLLIDWFNRGAIAAKKLTDEQKASLAERKAADKSYFDAKRSTLQKSTENAIDAIKREYGEAKDASQSLIDLAYRARDARMQAIDEEERAATDAYNIRLSQIKNIYQQSLSAEERKLQDQIDAIDAQTSAEDKAARLAELEKRVAESSGEDKARAQAELERYLLLQSREDEKQAIRDKIQELRDETGDIAKELQKRRDESIRLAEETKNAILTGAKVLRDAAEFDLADAIVRYENERDAKIKTEEAKLAASLNTLGIEETNLRNSYVTRLNDTAKWVTDMNTATKLLESRTITVTTVHKDEWSPNDLPKVHMVTPGKKLVQGGIVTQPTIALIGESGAEAVVPLNEAGNMGNIIINFTQPMFFDREDMMNQLVDKIRKGIQRQDRLRFGGVWNGR